MRSTGLLQHMSCMTGATLRDCWTTFTILLGNSFIQISRNATVCGGGRYHKNLGA